jgi:Rod binding domain-containing protein
MDRIPATDAVDRATFVLQSRITERTLPQIPRASGESMSNEQAARVARGFEALFIHELYKTMRQAMLDDDTSDDGDLSFGADILDTFGGIELANQLAQHGQGIGIAQMVYQHLTGSSALPVTTQYSAGALPPTSHQPLKQPPTEKAERPEPESQPSSSFLDRIEQRLSAHHSTIDQASRLYGVPSWLIKAVIAAESAGRADAVSPAGAKGLMQLMDATAADLGVSNPFDPTENILGGTRYLRMMLDRFGSIPLALAAYNAGPGAVARYGGIPPYAETQTYVQRVQQYARQFRVEA